MRKNSMNTRRLIFRTFVWCIPMIMLFSIQLETWSETHTGFSGKIQGYAIPNTHTSGKKYAKKNNVVLLGAFATSDEPTTQPIYLNFEYTTFNKFYLGVVVINTSNDKKDVVVTFELSGPRRGKEEEEITVPANSSYVAYIYDIIGRPGIYTFQGGIKDGESSKIKLLFEE